MGQTYAAPVGSGISIEEQPRERVDVGPIQYYPVAPEARSGVSHDRIPFGLGGDHPGFPPPPVSSGHSSKSGSRKKKSKKHGREGLRVPVYNVPHSMGGPPPVFIDPDGRGPYFYPVGQPQVMYSVGPSGFYHADPLAMGYSEHFGHPRPGMGPNGTSSTKNSVLISTFPDPQDDQIRQGSQAKVGKESDNVYSRIDASTNITTTNTNNENGEGVGNSDRSSGVVVGGETIVPQSFRKIFSDTRSNPSLIPGQQKDAHYVTYIKDQPAPPAQSAPPSQPTPPAAPLQAVKEESVTPKGEVVVTSSAVSAIASRTSERFIEVGEAEGHVARFLIDDDRTLQTVQVPGERVPLSVTRMQDLSSGLEEQTATLTLTELDLVDVVICYDAREAEVVTAMKDQMEAAQLTVYLGVLSDDVTADDMANTARAMFNARTLLVLLSETSTQRRQVRDLVSLAVLADKPVFPVAMGSRETIQNLLSIELKLQLEGCPWQAVSREGIVTVSEIDNLVQMVREQTTTLRNHDVIDQDYGRVSSWAVLHHRVLKMDRERAANVQIVTQVTSSPDGGEEGDTSGQSNGEGGEELVMSASEFWDQTFPQNDTVPWDKFRSQLRSQYMDEISTTLPRECMPDLMKALREGLVYTDVKGNDQIKRDTFIAFCTENGCEQDVWQIICEVAKHHQAVADVFHKDSSVRMVALEGIENYGSPAVISSLRNLVQDSDPAVRHLATGALCGCMMPGDQLSFASLMVALDDSHWTVRRAACQGMARLGATQAVDRLRRIGRNDINFHVRSAAASALAQIEAGNPPIGGDVAL